MNKQTGVPMAYPFVFLFVGKRDFLVTVKAEGG